MENMPSLAESILEQIGDAVIFADDTGTIRRWNHAAAALFGYSAAEALGQNLDLIIPERQRQRHWDGYQKTMDTGITRYGNDVLRVPAVHKDGHTLSIAFTVALLRTADNKVAAIVAVIRDESSRFAEDRALRKRLAEMDARLTALATESS